MTRRTSALAALMLAACGGGGSTPPPPPPPTTYTISGTASAAASQFADLDTADTNATPGNNDTLATAQALPSAATVGGWASVTTDPFDYYQASLGAGQVVTLIPADPAADLELCVAEAANLSNVTCSVNPPGQTEQIAIAGGMAVIIEVNAIDFGSSNYTLVLGQAPGSAQGSFVLGPRFIAGEVLVRFKETALAAAGAAEPATLAQKAASLGLVPLGGALQGRSALLGLPLDTGARASSLAALGAKVTRSRPDAYPSPEADARRESFALVTALRARADVASADLNFLHEATAVPDDTFYNFQWHLPLIQLPQAWDITTGTPASGAVEVAVIDTGVVLSHPDLLGQLLSGYDFVSNVTMAGDGNGIDSNANDPGDANGTSGSSFHGTHVAGTVAARTNNGVGVAGVSWGAKVIPIRVLGKGGGTSHDIIQGVRYAAGLSNDSGTVRSRRADVINLSLGCQGCFSATEQTEYTAARAAGSIIVAAAGNNNSPLLFYPASYTGVVSVSAVDSLKAKAPYSNFNASVDVAAPGGDTSVDLDGNGYVDGVLSTLTQQDALTPIYEFYQGTSMASPHVAGVVALMKAVCPTLTPANLDTMITSGAITDQLGGNAKTNNFGYGLINALKAVQAAQAQCGAPVAAALKIDPVSLDFGNAITSLPLTASKVGTAALAAVTVADNAPWLTVTPASVDGGGLGTYTATVSRAGLANGSYQATVTFTSGTKSVQVQVAMWVGAAAPTAGDAGFLYVLILDSAFTPIGQAQGRGTGGNYAFQFSGAPAGSYYLVAGTDQNNDGAICDAGEACGAWPTMGTPSPVVVSNANVSGLNFTVGFGSGAGIQSLVPGPTWPTEGFRRTSPGQKRFGGMP